MATRDYKARERSRPNRGRRGSSGFFWFVTGAVFGAFGVGLAWMLQERAPKPAQPNAQAQVQPRSEPSFVYHQLLPEMEVLVPDEELGASAPPPRKTVTKTPQRKESPTSEPPKSRQTAKAEKTPNATTGGGSYLVQVASFRSASDADRLKARLALLGVHARIQRVTVNGKAYHRVRAGPYEGAQQVNKTRALLSRQGFDSIAVKLK